MARRSQSRSSDPIELAPLVLVKGSEAFLADRAVSELRRQATERDASVERVEISAATYPAGQLDVVTSPSLFGEPRLIVIPNFEVTNDELMVDLLAYIDNPADDVWMIVRHNGGNRGKKVLDALKKAHVPTIAADPLKYDNEKIDLVMSEARRLHRRIEAEAAHMLVGALGSDLAEMMSALSQLMSDVEGTITTQAVHRYHSGRVEASGFDVADAALAGRTAQALTLLRHALATGVAPLMIVGALASKFRSMAYATAPRGALQSVSMNQWQFNRARRDVQGWTDTALAGAIEAIALADEEAKGLSRDPERAVEKCVLTICRLRGSARASEPGSRF